MSAAVGNFSQSRSDTAVLFCVVSLSSVSSVSTINIRLEIEAALRLLLALVLAITSIFNNLVAVSRHTQNTFIYSQYIARLFPKCAPVLKGPNYSGYYGCIFAAPLLAYASNTNSLFCMSAALHALSNFFIFFFVSLVAFHSALNLPDQTLMVFYQLVCFIILALNLLTACFLWSDMMVLLDLAGTNSWGLKMPNLPDYFICC